ncbi:MAG: T9SS type A sorting domain-containing protein [Cyclobacteriaceae bacterium]|jgi:poly(3-hydroxybutyrate) depolymerase|nr:T9SS type A sorting domain-containing protein [Flammeovirgaceae bacterium]
MNKLLFVALIFFSLNGFCQVLTNSTNISITKTWATQPSGYTYPVTIFVPTGAVPQGGFPVCILLHGNGSQNLAQLAGPPMIGQGQFGSVLPCHILVAPTGFENSWNICSENSDAPDVEMINDLVNNLQGYTNVNPNKIRILGTSNGAALANRIFIENTNAGIDIVCAVVSHLNDFQYHSGNFYKPNGATNPNTSFCGYNVVASPLTTRKYLSISNTNDPIIPYLGGTSAVGANFLPAETAAFTLATYKGYTGNMLTSGTTIGSASTLITEYSYLSGDVVHIKGSAGHQANATQKNYIANYFSDCDVVTEIEKDDFLEIEVYPNPSHDVLTIKVGESLVATDYVLYDNLGRTLWVGKLNLQTTHIDINGLSKGVYFLSVGENLKKVVKVVKK